MYRIDLVVDLSGCIDLVSIVPDPAPPLVIRSRDEADVYAPWILNPWQTYLDQKGMANSGVVQAMQAIAVFSADAQASTK